MGSSQEEVEEEREEKADKQPNGKIAFEQQKNKTIASILQNAIYPRHRLDCKI